MAEKRQPDKKLDQLRQEIASSRDRLGQDLGGLSYELDFRRKLRGSFQQHAGLWISAAVLTGVVVMARAIPKKKIVYTKDARTGRRFRGDEQKKGLLEAGLAMGALRFAAVLLRPVVVSFVRQKLGAYASGNGQRRS